MSQESLSETVRALLRECLKSIEQLEVLLLLHARPGEPWTATSASEVVRLAPELVGEALAGLHATGLVEENVDGYRYRPATEALARAVAELAQAFREQRAAVMSQMSANAIERIRSGTARAFADSFALGRKKRDD